MTREFKKISGDGEKAIVGGDSAILEVELVGGEDGDPVHWVPLDDAPVTIEKDTDYVINRHRRASAFVKAYGNAKVRIAVYAQRYEDITPVTDDSVAPEIFEIEAIDPAAATTQPETVAERPSVEVRETIVVESAESREAVPPPLVQLTEVVPETASAAAETTPEPTEPNEPKCIAPERVSMMAKALAAELGPMLLNEVLQLKDAPAAPTPPPLPNVQSSPPAASEPTDVDPLDIETLDDDEKPIDDAEFAPPPQEQPLDDAEFARRTGLPLAGRRRSRVAVGASLVAVAGTIALCAWFLWPDNRTAQAAPIAPAATTAAGTLPTAGIQCTPHGEPRTLPDGSTVVDYSCR